MKTEQIIEEREDSVKMKMRFKRFLSGFMAVATLAAVIIQPVAVSASELEPEEIPFEQQYAELKDVQDSLDPDEIVKANDIELSYGQEFDVEVDLSGIEGVDESKIKILFHEAKNETGTDFDTHTPDTYKAVYAVKPVSGHPAYRISRNITVKEPETEVQSERASESTVNVDDDTGDTEQSEEDSESHRETQNSESTADLESELTVSEVLEQVESNGIDLYTLGNIQRIHNALSAIGKKLADTEQNLETVQQQLKTAQEEVQKPFPKEAELSEKMERLAELNAMLNMDEKGGENLLADEGIGENPEVNVPEGCQDRIADGVHKTSILERLKEQKQQEQTSETQQKPKKKHEQEL